MQVLKNYLNGLKVAIIKNKRGEGMDNLSFPAFVLYLIVLNKIHNLNREVEVFKTQLRDFTFE